MKGSGLIERALGLRERLERAYEAFLVVDQDEIDGAWIEGVDDEPDDPCLEARQLAAMSLLDDGVEGYVLMRMHDHGDDTYAVSTNYYVPNDSWGGVTKALRGMDAEINRWTT